MKTKSLKMFFALVAYFLLHSSPNQAADANLGLGLAVNGNFKEAVDVWLPLAESGDMEAQYYMGVVYRDGLGVAINYDKFKLWTSRSAFQGSTSAMYNLGAMYENALGVMEDKQKAFLWYSRAAQQGDVEAMVRSGRALRGQDYLCEDKLHCDYIIKYFYKPAAEKANTEAMVYMANILLISNSSDKKVEALAWLLIARKIGIEDEFLDDNVEKILAEFRGKALYKMAVKAAIVCETKYLEGCYFPSG